MNGKGILILIAALAVICVGSILGGIEGMFIAFGVAVAVLLLGVAIFIKMQAARAAKEEKDKKIIELEQQNQLIKRLQDDTYQFPAEKFFDECRKNKILSIDNEFAKKKVWVLFCGILDEEKIPTEFREKYVSRIESYFNEGKKEYDRKEEIKKITPQWSKLDEKKKEIVSANKRNKNLIGIEKKRRKITDDIYREKRLIADTENTLANVDKLDGGSRMQVIMGMSNIQSNLEFSKNIVKRLEKELEELDNKIILDNYSTQEIFENLNITCSVEKRYDDVLEVKLRIFNNLKPDAPDDVKLIADGSIQIDVYYGDILVDSVPVSLPDKGIVCGAGANLITYCEKYMIGDGEYTCKITPNHLWLMED